MQITSGSRHFYWKQEKPEIELIFIESDLYYKSRTSAAGEKYAQIPSKTSADHEKLYQRKAPLSLKWWMVRDERWEPVHVPFPFSSFLPFYVVFDLMFDIFGSPLWELRILGKLGILFPDDLAPTVKSGILLTVDLASCNVFRESPLSILSPLSFPRSSRCLASRPGRPAFLLQLASCVLQLLLPIL